MSGHVYTLAQIKDGTGFAPDARFTQLGTHAGTGYGVTLDALSGIGAAVSEGWGDYGYRIIALIGTLDGSAIAQVEHRDGSRFYVAADTYGTHLRRGFDTAEEAQAALHAHYAPEAFQ